MAVLYKQNYMTSVLAVRQKAWMVFFIGTEDGQLIKVCINTLNTKSIMIIVIYLYIYTINISQEALYSNRLPDTIGSFMLSFIFTKPYVSPSNAEACLLTRQLMSRIG